MKKTQVFLLISTFILIGIIGANALFLKEKFGIPFGFSDKAIVYTISSSGEYPRFLKAVIDPEDVKPGDVQKMLIEAESPDGIKEIKAEIEHDKGIDKLILNLEGGDEKHGQWVGEWDVHSTHSETYRTTFIAEDNTGKINKVVLAWTDACVVPNNGDWILDGDCAISGVHGVDNGNFTVSGGYTLTINNGATFAWNSGKSITISNGSIAIASGGQLKKTNLWMIDSDDDGYATNVQYAQSDSPAGGKRRYLVIETGIDCDDGSDSIYPGVITGTKDCDVDNYYFTDGTASATGTNYCKFRDYSNANKVCQNDGTVSDPDCVSCADSTVATCGTCKYATGACSSCTNYNTSASCGTKDCDYLNYYYTLGTEGVMDTNYCKYRDYVDQTKYCDGTGSCGNPSCSSYSSDTRETCGFCRKVDNCSVSGQSCSYYNFGVTCGVDACSRCDSSGTCEKMETTWSSLSYGCLGQNQRCIDGVCKTCGGLLSDDGCGGCTGQGSRSCWYSASCCVDACTSHGAAPVYEQFNDDTSCTLCKTFNPGSDCFPCDGPYQCGMSPAYHSFFKYCYYRTSEYTQTNSWNGAGTYNRLCVCTF